MLVYLSSHEYGKELVQKISNFYRRANNVYFVYFVDKSLIDDEVEDRSNGIRPTTSVPQLKRKNNQKKTSEAPPVASRKKLLPLFRKSETEGLQPLTPKERPWSSQHPQL